MYPEQVKAKFKVDQHETTPWCIFPDGNQITVKGPELKDWGYTKTHGTDFAADSNLHIVARQVTAIKDGLRRWSFYIEWAMFQLWSSGGQESINESTKVGPLAQRYLTELTGWESVWEETNRTRIELVMNLAGITVSQSRFIAVSSC